MLAGLILFGYLVGAIPIGVIVARAKGIDLMKVGSGNIGATNVKRALGTKWGLIVFFADVLKGVIPAVVGRLLAPSILPVALGDYSLSVVELSALAGIAAIAGHCLSPFLKFKGGKGISTALGAILASDPLVALSSFGLFIVVVWIWRYISLGSLCAAIAAFGFSFLFGSGPLLHGFYAALAVFVWVRHVPNIKRLASGTESKFSFKSTKTEASGP